MAPEDVGRLVKAHRGLGLLDQHVADAITQLCDSFILPAGVTVEDLLAARQRAEDAHQVISDVDVATIQGVQGSNESTSRASGRENTPPPRLFRLMARISFPLLLVLPTFMLACAASSSDGHAIEPTTNALVVTPPVASDCSVDITDDFNAWIDTVADGDTISLVPNGCYRAEGTILFMDRHNITIQGNGATIKATTNVNAADGRVRARLNFELGSGIVVRDITLQGSNFAPDCVRQRSECRNSQLEFDANIRIEGTDGVLIENVRLTNSHGDGVEVGPGGNGNWDSQGVGAVIPRNITVRHSTVDTVGRHAFTCVACRNFVVQGNSVTNIAFHVVDVEIEGSTWPGDLTLEGNTYSKVWGSLLSAYGALATTSWGPFVVRDNKQAEGDLPRICSAPIWFHNPDDPAAVVEAVTIENNRVSTYGSGIYVRQIGGGTVQADVRRNVIAFLPSTGCGSRTGVAYVADSASGTIAGNTFVNATSIFDSDPQTEAPDPPQVGLTVCGNRTASVGAFHEPSPCPMLTPPVASDCSVDITDDFNAWVDTVVADGDTIGLAPSGCYRAEGTIKFRSRHNITLEGNGATIKATTEVAANTERARLDFDLGGGFVVRDLTLEGNGFTPDSDCVWQRGCDNYELATDSNIRIRGSDFVLIENVRLRSSHGDAVKVGPGGNWDSQGVGAIIPRNITVRNSTVEAAGRHAFTCAACRNFVVQDNSITNVGYHAVGVQISAATWPGDLALEGNTYSKVWGSLLSADGGIAASWGPFVLRDNRQQDGDLPRICSAPIWITNPQNPAAVVEPMTIENNRLSTYGSGIYIGQAGGGTIRGDVERNTINFLPSSGCGSRAGVAYVADFASGTIAGNTFVNAMSIFDSDPQTVAPDPPQLDVTICGNRSTAAGAFDEPSPCP